jgi:hypothetical protein
MKGFCLSIAYSASTGGAGTLVGMAYFGIFFENLFFIFSLNSNIY